MFTSDERGSDLGRLPLLQLAAAFRALFQAPKSTDLPPALEENNRMLSVPSESGLHRDEMCFQGQECHRWYDLNYENRMQAAIAWSRAK